MNLRNDRSVMFFIFCISTLPIWAEDRVSFPEVFKKGYIEVTGKSEGRQSRFQALRSAEVMAQRELLKILQKIRISGSHEIGSEASATDIEGFLRGAAPCGSVYHEEKGQAEACLHLNLRGPRGLYEGILPWLKEKKYGSPEMRMTAFSGRAPKTNSGAAGFDGLILDMRALPFRPALLNRILTSQNSLVFDPLCIKTDLLVVHGCSAYSADLPAARSLLQNRGSRNPLVLAVPELNEDTDAKVSPEQAEQILAAEEAFQVLSQVKIVYVVQE